MTDRILLTGATGNTGRVVAQRLRELDQPFVGMTRSTRRKLELDALGIESVMGDFDEPTSLDAALQGVDVAYLVCTPDELLIPREVAFIRAAQRAGVRRIVKCSAFSADLLGSSATLRAHAAIEGELARSGLEHTILRPHGYMQTFTLFCWVLIQKAGAISLPAGDGGIPLIDVRDVAEVAVRALTEPGHDRRIYDLTGPEVLDMHQQAAILSRVLERPIHYIPGQAWQLVMMMRALGVPPTAAEHVDEVFAIQRAGGWNRTTSTLRDLGLVPTSYETFLRDLLAGRTGGGNSFEPPNTRVNALINTIMPPMTRAYLFMSGAGRKARTHQA